MTGTFTSTPLEFAVAPVVRGLCDQSEAALARAECEQKCAGYKQKIRKLQQRLAEVEVDLDHKNRLLESENQRASSAERLNQNMARIAEINNQRTTVLLSIHKVVYSKMWWWSKIKSIKEILCAKCDPDRR